MTDKTKKTCWHCLLAHALKELLHPLNIQVLTEVQVVADPPKADIILLRRDGSTWTKEQSDSLADGLRDTNAETLLIEFKYTESVNKNTFEKLFVYDYLYRESEKLKAHHLQSFLVSAKTPNTDILARYGFKPTEKKGVYISKIPFFSAIQVLLLNEIEDKPHNAVFKCFASRQKEKNKAFETMNHHVLPGRTSTALAWVTTGLLEIMMGKTLDNPEVTGWTPEEVIELGKKWIESKVFQEAESKMLLRLLQCRFGEVPNWAKEKITKTDRATLEEWSLRFVNAKSLEDVFGT